MAAVQYHATWVDREDAPGRVHPKATFWSFNYASQASGVTSPLRTLHCLRLHTIAPDCFTTQAGGVASLLRTLMLLTGCLAFLIDRRLLSVADLGLGAGAASGAAASGGASGPRVVPGLGAIPSDTTLGRLPTLATMLTVLERRIVDEVRR